MYDIYNRLLVNAYYEIKTIFLDRESMISTHVHISHMKSFKDSSLTPPLPHPNYLDQNYK